MRPWRRIAPAEEARGRARSWKKALAIFLLVGLLITATMAALTISRHPDPRPGPNPSPADVRRARSVLSQYAEARRDGAGRLQGDGAAMAAVAALVRPRTGLESLRLSLGEDRISMAGSEEIAGGWWINIQVSAWAAPHGPPPLEISVGRLQIPRWATPMALRLLRFGFGLRGVDLPPLEESLQSLSITRGRLVAELRFPEPSGAPNAAAGLQPAQVDRSLVLQIYCRLVEAQKERPEPALEVQVQRAFAAGGPSVSTRSNGAAFVAVGIFVSNAGIGELAGLTRSQIRQCRKRGPTVRLLGREDLAGHWALSAALTVLYGDTASAAAGEWKELLDAGREGSGFSFVDLAADRSGMMAARLALDPGQASTMQRRLAAVGEREMLPRQLRSLPEAMDEVEFRRRYGSVGSPAFRDEIGRIDAALRAAWLAGE